MLSKSFEAMQPVGVMARIEVENYNPEWPREWPRELPVEKIYSHPLVLVILAVPNGESWAWFADEVVLFSVWPRKEAA